MSRETIWLRRRGVFFWGVLALGVLCQAFGPHLKIKNNKFVLPPSFVASSPDIRPAEIVTRERQWQVVSGILTLAGTLGLALCYRERLFGARSAQFGVAGRSDEDSISIPMVK